jgi:hypothetical protein
MTQISNERLAEIEAQAWECSTWPEWLKERVDDAMEVSGNVDMSTEQVLAYAILIEQALRASSGVEVKALPAQDLLLKLLRYDAENGGLYWLPRTPDMFIDNGRGQEWACNVWNAKHAGKEAFTASDPSGYLHGKINGVKYQAHRVIWKMLNGKDPVTIDHINGRKFDNREVNLRDATVAENSRNYSKPPGNTSKYRGVCWVERDQRWAARISVGTRKISLGNFADEEQAARAYDSAAREHHGAFATLNFPAAAALSQNKGG